VALRCFVDSILYVNAQWFGNSSPTCRTVLPFPPSEDTAMLKTHLRLMAALVCAAQIVAATAHDTKPTANIDSNRTAADRAQKILDTTAQWTNLFNGTDLNGWTGDTNGYVVENGVLVCKKGGQNLVTKKQYSDFALHFEFKLEESGNNGIGIRVPKEGHPASDGLEIQILDHHGSLYEVDAQMANGKKQKLNWLKPWQYHGSIYGIYPAKLGYLKPVGEWNTETIVAIEDHIMVILNGAVIVDAFLDDLTPLAAASHKGMHNKTGHIILAGHSDRVEFRQLKIADYSVSPTQATSTNDNLPPAGFETLFNGKDLTDWKGLAHKNAVARRELEGAALAEAQAAADAKMQSHWSVIDGILTYDGTGDSLCTKQDFGDFELYVDWKIPPGADSGLYLRGTPQVQIWDPWDMRLKKDQAAPTTGEEWVALYTNGRNLGSGGLWNNKHWRNAPTVLADKKPGEWNTFLIRMVGEKVSIWLNDILVVDRVKLENYWDKTGMLPIPRADQIELQHHGSELFFKNLYIRELPF